MYDIPFLKMAASTDELTDDYDKVNMYLLWAANKWWGTCYSTGRAGPV